MKILHCIRKSLYEEMKNDVYFGRLLLEKNPFIHCSSIEYFWRVSPNFTNETEEMVLLVIETECLDVPVKWEDLEKCGRKYPHIYGLIKAEAIQQVLPYQKAKDGSWLKNQELMKVPNQ